MIEKHRQQIHARIILEADRAKKRELQRIAVIIYACMNLHALDRREAFRFLHVDAEAAVLLLIRPEADTVRRADIGSHDRILSPLQNLQDISVE